MSDIRYAIRSMLHARWFTVGAILTFTLGIGVNVAVFSAVDRMLFRTLPYARPDDLYQLQQFNKTTGQGYGQMPASLLVELRRQRRGIVDASEAGFSTSFTFAQDPVDEPYFRLTDVSYNTLSVFGVRPVIGRDFTRDDAASKRAEALVSYDFWQSRLGGAPDVVGRTLWSERKPTEIVGVLPSEFIAASAFLDPSSSGLVLDYDTMEVAAPDGGAFAPYVRLRPCVSAASVAAEVNTLAEAEAIARQSPQWHTWSQQFAFRLTPLKQVLFGGYVDYLVLISVAAALVLLVACGNLASLMLVRFRSREHVAATQLALGASPARLLTSAFAEAGLLAVCGAVIGLTTFAWVSAGLRALLPPIFSRYAAGVTDARVILFTIIAAVTSALVVGLVPAWRIRHVDAMTLLKRSSTAARGRRVGGRSLLAAEAGLSVLLVAAAVATGRSLLKLEHTSLGFVPQGLSRVTVSLPWTTDEALRLQQYSGVLEVLRRLPGVRLAGATNDIFLSGDVGWKGFGKGFERVGVRSNITDTFFETLGTPILAGRTISAGEVASRAPVAVVNLSGLRLLWPHATPAEAVGRFLPFDDEPRREVIGVVADMRSDYAANVRAELFLPVDPADVRRLDFVARPEVGASLSVADLRARVRQQVAEPTHVAIGAVTTSLDAGLLNQRFRATLFTSFGAVALVLAALGLYAVGTFEVTLRQAELGIRISLGATPRDLRRLVIREALAPVAVGVLAGLVVTYWAARFLQSFLYHVDARNPAELAVVAAVLLGVTVIAAWIPARRAARTDPATVLRAQ